MNTAAERTNHHWRKHPPVKVGDTFGPYTVTATLPRGHKGRSDERVEWRCVCGRWGESWVFNLRKIERCRHQDQTGKPTECGMRLDNRRRSRLGVAFR